MSAAGRRTWVDAFDRVPVTTSTRNGPVGMETGRARLRLHPDGLEVRRRSGRSLLRAGVIRLYAAVSALMRAGVPSTR